MGWLKKFGPAQNILGPVKGQTIRIRDWWNYLMNLLYIFKWIFIAQLWKYDDENEMLENHKGKWNGRKDIKSYIPKEGEEGNIENDYCHVLGTVIY